MIGIISFLTSEIAQVRSLFLGKSVILLQCSSIPAVYHLIQQTDPSQSTKLMILGPACSGAAELMGEIAQRFMNITQVYT